MSLASLFMVSVRNVQFVSVILHFAFVHFLVAATDTPQLHYQHRYVVRRYRLELQCHITVVQQSKPTVILERPGLHIIHRKHDKRLGLGSR